jgi:hypothetical protein
MIDDVPMVYLAPEDAKTATAAGIDFARNLAGAPSALFMLALGEQEEIIRLAIRRAGFSKRQARIAAEAFECGAKFEYTRIANAAHTQHGTA